MKKRMYKKLSLTEKTIILYRWQTEPLSVKKLAVEYSVAVGTIHNLVKDVQKFGQISRPVILPDGFVKKRPVVKLKESAVSLKETKNYVDKAAKNARDSAIIGDLIRKEQVDRQIAATEYFDNTNDVTVSTPMRTLSWYAKRAIRPEDMTTVEYFSAAGCSVAETMMGILIDAPTASNCKIATEVLHKIMPVAGLVAYHANGTTINAQQNNVVTNKTMSLDDLYASFPKS
jgi:hypothetical protein